MLLYEMFNSSTDLKSSVEETIMYLKANGLKSISIDMLVSILNDNGYSEVTNENIVDILNTISCVVSVDANMINVSTEKTVDDGEDKFNKEKVSNMASKYVQSQHT